MRIRWSVFTFGMLRGAVFLATVVVAALPSGGQGVAPATVPALHTGIQATLIASYAPDGNPARALLTIVDLERLKFESLEQIVNDIDGRGEDVFVALGAPALIATFDGDKLETLPGLDLEFLSAQALSPNRRWLAFARDPRKRDAGEEIWLWDLRRKSGRVLLRMPTDRYAYSMDWRDDETLIAAVAGTFGESPELLVLTGRKVVSRFRTNGASFRLIGPDRIVQIVWSAPGVYPEHERSYMRDLAGGNVTRIPGGWIPLCPSEDGNQMLMGRYTHERRLATSTELGLAPIPDLTQIRSVGGVPGGLYSCVWQDRPSSD